MHTNELVPDGSSFGGSPVALCPPRFDRGGAGSSGLRGMAHSGRRNRLLSCPKAARPIRENILEINHLHDLAGIREEDDHVVDRRTRHLDRAAPRRSAAGLRCAQGSPRARWARSRSRTAARSRAISVTPRPRRRLACRRSLALDAEVELAIGPRPARPATWRLHPRLPENRAPTRRAAGRGSHPPGQHLGRIAFPEARGAQAISSSPSPMVAIRIALDEKPAASKRPPFAVGACSGRGRSGLRAAWKQR